MILRELPLGVGKARLTLSSIECFVWASCGIRAFRVLRILGLRAFQVVWVFLAVSFGFFLLVSVRSFLCILHVYLGAPYAFFIKFSSTYQKTKKIKNNRTR
jgi:hypothetical protein